MSLPVGPISVHSPFWFFPTFARFTRFALTLCRSAGGWSTWKDWVFRLSANHYGWCWCFDGRSHGFHWGRWRFRILFIRFFFLLPGGSRGDKGDIWGQVKTSRGWNFWQGFHRVTLAKLQCFCPHYFFKGFWTGQVQTVQTRLRQPWHKYSSLSRFTMKHA